MENKDVVKNFSLRISESTLEKIRKEIAFQDRSVNWWIRKAIDEKLQKNKET